MKASLDTNAIIHFYKAGLENIIFSMFVDGVIIYEQIRNVELENHGEEILERVDEDIANGKIQIYTDALLKELAVYKMFKINVEENRLLYQAGDLGEVYAISLAQTIGAYSLVTDDTKSGGPYASLLQLDYDIIPFNFTDILLLRYLMDAANAEQTVNDFNSINEKSMLNWSFTSQIKKFIKRFVSDPYKEEERKWMNEFIEKYNIRLKTKFLELRQLIE